MRKRISLLIAALMLALTMSFGAVSAFAAPITCPAGQTATQTSPGTFECVNNAGSGNPNTERHQGTGAKV
jgi:hypothetical protein